MEYDLVQSITYYAPAHCLFVIYERPELPHLQHLFRLSHLYLLHAHTATSYNDITPKNTAEKIIATICNAKLIPMAARILDVSESSRGYALGLNSSSSCMSNLTQSVTNVAFASFWRLGLKLYWQQQHPLHARVELTMVEAIVIKHETKLVVS